MHLGTHQRKQLGTHQGHAPELCIKVRIGAMHRGYASDTHEVMNLFIKRSKDLLSARAKLFAAAY